MGNLSLFSVTDQEDNPSLSLALRSYIGAYPTSGSWTFFYYTAHLVSEWYSSLSPLIISQGKCHSIWLPEVKIGDC